GLQVLVARRPFRNRALGNSVVVVIVVGVVVQRPDRVRRNPLLQLFDLELRHVGPPCFSGVSRQASRPPARVTYVFLPSLSGGPRGVHTPDQGWQAVRRDLRFQLFTANVARAARSLWLVAVSLLLRVPLVELPGQRSDARDVISLTAFAPAPTLQP